MKNRARAGSAVISLLAFGILLTASVVPHTVPAQAASYTDYYVGPDGSDANSGVLSSAPLRTIQVALNKVHAGDTIHLAPGIYHGQPTTVRDGAPGAPITIRGPENGMNRAGRYRAVLYGTGRIFNINNSYYTLSGFTIDGQERLAGVTYPTTLAAARSFKSSLAARVVDGRLIYLGSADSARGVTGVAIRNMFLSGAGGECVRIRGDAYANEISSSVIQWCGMRGTGDGVSSYRYHNGEGVYIGTSPKTVGTLPDRSAGNVIRGNTIWTYGSECMDVKENAHNNLFQSNDCRYNDEPLSFSGSNVEVRGYDNTVEGNTMAGSQGYGLKLNVDDASYDKGGNVIRNNTFSGSAGASVYNGNKAPQGVFCGNMFNSITVLVVGYPQGASTTACA